MDSISPAHRKVSSDTEKNGEQLMTHSSRKILLITYSSTQFNDTNVSGTRLSVNWYQCHAFNPLLNGICDVRDNLQFAKIHKEDERYMESLW
jgi:hypothetical protein